MVTHMNWIMVIPVWSILTLPSLISIFLTSLFGLNAVRLRPPEAWLRGYGLVELAFTLSLAGMGTMAATSAVSVLVGANLYSPRGCLMTTCIAGVFIFSAKHLPWKRWIHRWQQEDPHGKG